MPCLSCGSRKLAEFSAEMIIHLPGLKNLDNSGIWVFPKLTVCLGCGFSGFAIPESETTLLAGATEDKEDSPERRSPPSLLEP